MPDGSLFPQAHPSFEERDLFAWLKARETGRDLAWVDDLLKADGAPTTQAPKVPATPAGSGAAAAPSVHAPSATSAPAAHAAGGAGHGAGAEMPGHKWLRREIGAKGKFKYFYTEGQALGRQPKQGDELNLGHQKGTHDWVRVTKTGDGKVGYKKIKPVHDAAGKLVDFEDGGQEQETDHAGWNAKMAEGFGDSHYAAMDARVRRWGAAVYRHVPAQVFDQLWDKDPAAAKGMSSHQIIDHLIKQTDEAHIKLGGKMASAFKNVGIHDEGAAKEMIGFLMSRRGWHPDARAALLGAAQGGFETARVAKNYQAMAKHAEALAGKGMVDSGHIAKVMSAQNQGFSRYKNVGEYHAHKASANAARLAEHNTARRAGGLSEHTMDEFLLHKRSVAGKLAAEKRQANPDNTQTQKTPFKRLDTMSPEEFEAWHKLARHGKDGQGGEAGREKAFKEQFLDAPLARGHAAPDAGDQNPAKLVDEVVTANRKGGATKKESRQAKDDQKILDGMTPQQKEDFDKGVQAEFDKRKADRDARKAGVKPQTPTDNKGGVDYAKDTHEALMARLAHPDRPAAKGTITPDMERAFVRNLQGRLKAEGKDDLSPALLQKEASDAAANIKRAYGGKDDVPAELFADAWRKHQRGQFPDLQQGAKPSARPAAPAAAPPAQQAPQPQAGVGVSAARAQSNAQAENDAMRRRHAADAQEQDEAYVRGNPADAVGRTVPRPGAPAPAGANGLTAAQNAENLAAIQAGKPLPHMPPAAARTPPAQQAAKPAERMRPEDDVAGRLAAHAQALEESGKEDPETKAAVHAAKLLSADKRLGGGMTPEEAAAEAARKTGAAAEGVAARLREVVRGSDGSMAATQAKPARPVPAAGDSAQDPRAVVGASSGAEEEALPQESVIPLPEGAQAGAPEGREGDTAEQPAAAAEDAAPSPVDEAVHLAQGAAEHEPEAVPEHIDEAVRRVEEVAAKDVHAGAEEADKVGAVVDELAAEGKIGEDKAAEIHEALEDVKHDAAGTPHRAVGEAGAEPSEGVSTANKIKEDSEQREALLDAFSGKRLVSAEAARKKVGNVHGHFSERELGRMVQDGLLIADRNGYRVTPAGEQYKKEANARVLAAFGVGPDDEAAAAQNPADAVAPAAPAQQAEEKSELPAVAAVAPSQAATALPAHLPFAPSSQPAERQTLLAQPQQSQASAPKSLKDAHAQMKAAYEAKDMAKLARLLEQAKALPAVDSKSMSAARQKETTAFYAERLAMLQDPSKAHAWKQQQDAADDAAEDAAVAAAGDDTDDAELDENGKIVNDGAEGVAADDEEENLGAAVAPAALAQPSVEANKETQELPDAQDPEVAVAAKTPVQQKQPSSAAPTAAPTAAPLPVPSDAVASATPAQPLAKPEPQELPAKQDPAAAVAAQAPARPPAEQTPPLLAPLRLVNTKRFYGDDEDDEDDEDGWTPAVVTRVRPGENREEEEEYPDPWTDPEVVGYSGSGKSSHYSGSGKSSRSPAPSLSDEDAKAQAVDWLKEQHEVAGGSLTHKTLGDYAQRQIAKFRKEGALKNATKDDLVQALADRHGLYGSDRKPAPPAETLVQSPAAAVQEAAKGKREPSRPPLPPASPAPPAPPSRPAVTRRAGAASAQEPLPPPPDKFSDEDDDPAAAVAPSSKHHAIVEEMLAKLDAMGQGKKAKAPEEQKAAEEQKRYASFLDLAQKHGINEADLPALRKRFGIPQDVAEGIRNREDNHRWKGLGRGTFGALVPDPKATDEFHGTKWAETKLGQSLYDEKKAQGFYKKHGIEQKHRDFIGDVSQRVLKHHAQKTDNADPGTSRKDRTENARAAAVDDVRDVRRVLGALQDVQHESKDHHEHVAAAAEAAHKGSPAAVITALEKIARKLTLDLKEQRYNGHAEQALDTLAALHAAAHRNSAPVQGMIEAEKASDPDMTDEDARAAVDDKMREHGVGKVADVFKDSKFARDWAQKRNNDSKELHQEKPEHKDLFHADAGRRLHGLLHWLGSFGGKLGESAKRATRKAGMAKSAWEGFDDFEDLFGMAA